MDGVSSGGGNNIKRAIAILLGGCGTIIFLFWGSGTFSSKESPSFFADVKTAFSETFLQNETFRGEFDFRDGADAAGAAPEERIVCAFDTVERPLRESVIFNEIAWMGTSESYMEEWIELMNRATGTADLSFWRIMDRGGDISITLPKNTALAPGGFLVIRRGKETGEFSGSLKNADELIRLFDDGCMLRDEAGGAKWEAGDNETKQTMERDTSGFGWHTSASPGGTPGNENSNLKFQISNLSEIKNDPVQTEETVQQNEKESKELKEPSLQTIKADPAGKETVRPITIIEVVAGVEGNAGYEFIRLHNNSDVPIDLTGWFVKKRSSTGKETTLVSSARLEGKTIASGSDFLMAREEGYSGPPEPDIWWPKSYALAEKRNAIILYDGGGEKAGEYSW